MEDITDKIGELYKTVGWPLVSILAGAALLFGIWIAVSFMLSDGDEQKLKKAKAKLKSFVIAWVVLFAVSALTPLIVAMLQTWAQG